VGKAKEGYSATMDATAPARAVIVEKSMEAATATMDGAKVAADFTAEKSKEAATATMDGAKVAADFTAEKSKEAAAATMEGAKVAGEWTAEMSSKALAGATEAFEKLGDVAGFQAMFGLVDTSDEGLEKLFKEVDDDGSGEITDAEMKTMLTKIYGGAVNDDIITKMMAAADTDKNGLVDLAEFKVIMRAERAA